MSHHAQLFCRKLDQILSGKACKTSQEKAEAERRARLRSMPSHPINRTDGRWRKDSQHAWMSLTLVADGPGRVEVSQLFFYILQHPERVLFLRRGHTVGQPSGMDGHCTYTLDPSAWKICRHLLGCVSWGVWFFFCSGCTGWFSTPLIFNCTIISIQNSEYCNAYLDLNQKKKVKTFPFRCSNWSIIFLYNCLNSK